MHWLDALLNSMDLKRKNGETLGALGAKDASISTYLDLVASNLETAGLAIRRIAQQLRDLRREMEELDG